MHCAILLNPPHQHLFLVCAGEEVVLPGDYCHDSPWLLETGGRGTIGGVYCVHCAIF